MESEFHHSVEVMGWDEQTVNFLGPHDQRGDLGTDRVMV